MQIDTSKVKWDETPKVAAAPQIDAGQVKWDDNVQAPLQAQTQPQKPKKEYGTLEKIYDVVTNNPVANYIPNKIKEWSGIDEDKKVDKETLYNIESLAKVDTRLIGDATPKQKEQYLLNVAKVLDKKGYKLAEVEDGDKKEYVALDAKGNQKEITNNFFNSLVDGILADKYEMAGAIAGAAKGYNLTKAIPSPWTKALGILGGGAIGAMAGTAADTAEVTYKTGQEFKIEDFFNELNKSAALDVAGAVAGAAIIKTGSVVAKGAKKSVEPVIDYVKNNNIAGAKKQLLSDLGVDEAQAAKALENAKLEYKEVEGYAKDGIISDVAKKQEELLAVASQDKRMGKNIIHDIVLDDKDAALNVSKQVDARTKNLINSFEDVAIDGTDVKRAVEGYEKQVGANYGKMRDTFKESFENVDYAFDLKALKTDEIMRNVVDDIVNPYDKDVAKNLLTKVEKIVGDEGGITRNFDNLVEMRQVVNDFYSRASKSLSHDSKEAFAQLKKNIDTELYSAIDKNIPQEMQKPLKDMFDGAIKEYRDMYAIKDTKLYSTLMDDGMSASARMDALIKHTADDEMEFATLLQKLPSQEQAKIENSITKAVLDKNLFGASNELQVIDYNKAVTTLGKLENFMVTQSGKDSVKLIKEMAEKYGDDLDLLRAANQAGVDTGAGIATTIVGKIQYKLAKRSFDKITRLLPTDDGRRLAMYHNIADALKKSRTPMDMAKRVAGSENIAKADKADLLDWARDFNRANSVNNEQQAQKLLLEIEAKEAAKAQADVEAKAMLDDFDAIDPAEILAVQKLGGYDALAQTVKNLNDPSRRSVEDVKKFVDAKAKIAPDRLQKQIIDIKYPIKDAEAKIAKLLESSGDEVAAIVDEQTLKVLQYDIKQGTLRNDKLKDAYKQVMQLYDAKAVQKTPQELLQGKEVELKNLLRKAEFEESVDNVAGASAQRDSAKALQDEIDELKRQTEPTSNAEIRTSKKLSSQAQAAKDIADMNYHDEDEAKQAVKDLFRKNTSEEKNFKNMNAEDMAEYERVHGGDASPKQKSNEIAYDEDGEVIPFANPHIGAGVVAGSGNALEYDEEGNLVGFDTEKFVTGFLAGTIGSKAGASALKKFNPKLYNYIAGVSKEFPNMATANPKLLAEIYKSAPTTKGQALMFAGAKAIKADIGKLDDAMKLVDNGANEADVWKQTGWFKGDDGKWRFEVDDSKIKYKPIPKQKVEFDGREFEQNYANLSEIIDHPELFAKYPELKEMLVSINDIGGKGGSYNAGVNMIALNKGNLSQLEDEAVQVIRTQIRDLDKNPIDKNYAKLNAKFIKEGLSTDEIMDIANKIDATPTAKKIQSLNTELYKAMDNANKSGAKVLNSDGRSTLLHEVQHAVQEIENFARGGSPTDKAVVQKAFDELYKRYDYLPSVKKLENDFLSGKLTNDDFKKEILSIANTTEDGGLKGYLHDFYQRLHGEAEARLTQKRVIDGYENFPLNDLDVPRDELIKKFDGGVAEMSIETEARYINPKNGNLTPQFKKDAINMPKSLSKKEFAKQYGDTYGWTSVETPIGEMKFNVNSAYKHMESDNTYFADRVNFSGAFNQALIDPLMIVKNPLKDGQTEYYLPIKSEMDDILHFINIAKDKNGELKQITFFDVSEDEAKRIIKSQGNNMLYFKYSTATKQMLDTGDAMQIPKKLPSMSESISKDYKDSQGFYSVLEKTIDEKVGGKVDSASLAKMLDKNGVKQDEIEWSGLKELMESKEKLTKEEIAETIKENRLVVEVVERDSQLDKETINSLKMFDNDRFAEIEGKIPKYSEYKLKGGENYRELLFTKPAKLPEDVKFIKADDGYWYAEKAPYDGTNVVTSAKTKAGLEKELNAQEFKSNHWDEGNILVFTRVDDRTIDGKKALFVQELQSDWHQAGRKEGYGKKIPSAPFKKNWHELGLKRMVQEAVANDYDKIAWTTGKQQADRYSLEKTVDTVVYNKDAGVIQATNGSKEVFFKRVANEKEIEDIMGKELTARLLDKKNTTTESVHVLQGEELKFGGEGMQAFYDEIVPNAAKKLFKKWGVKPKMEELDDVEQMVWSVDITPAMKEDVKKYGQPLYAVGGAVIANEATKGDEQ